MQKLLKRTAQAERQVATRLKKERDKVYRVELTKRRREEKQHLAALAVDIHAARKARRDKWDLGPLAPRRDMGDNSFGAMSEPRSQRQSNLKGWELEERCSWAGGAKYLNLAPKDRVVVLEGPSKGKIDRITKINMKTGCVELENLNKITIKVPDHFKKAILDAPATQTIPSELPISAIRLVHPLTDPETGLTRDVIVRQLARGPVTWIRQTGWRSWTRYIPGLNVAIPWPEREAIKRTDKPGDTLRIDVEKQTFIPTLLQPPMPEALLDQLRNRYSKFRTRHEEDFIMRKEAEEREKLGRRLLDVSMRTPLQAFNKQQREKRKARGQPQLTDEMLDKIGQVIAQKKMDALNAAGISEVKTGTQSGSQIPDSAIPTSDAGKDAHPPQ